MKQQRAKRTMFATLAVVLLGAIAFAVNALSATPTAKPDFSLAMGAASTTVARGTNGTNTVTVTPTGGFGGSVSLSASGVPSGVSVNLGGSGNNRTVAIAAGSSAIASSSTITITGKSGSLTHTTSFQLVVTVPDFAMSVGPSSLTLVRGQSATSTVSITRSGGFADAITLSTSTLPSGVTASYSPTNPSTANTRSIIFTATSTASVGTFAVTVKGTSGSLAHTAGFTLVVPQPTFALWVYDDNINLPQGASGAFSIMIDRQNAYTSAVAFTVSGLPANTTATFVPSSTTGNSVSLQIATTSKTVLGSYTLTVKGTGCGVTLTTVAHLTVSAGGGGNKPFTISGSATDLLAPGVTSAINLSLYNPNNQPLQVTGLNVTIAGTSKTACGTDNYTIRQFSGTYPTIPANSTRTLSQLGVPSSAWPAITMINKPVNQDVCKGTTLQLGYTGTGGGS